MATVPRGKGARQAAAREALGSPFRREHEESAARAFNKPPEPKTFDDLIAWFREWAAAEVHWVKSALHGPGVWRDYGADAKGGSLLGSKAYSEPFRRFLENSPSETDANGAFVRPLRAALDRLSRYLPDLAQHLFRLLLVDGDWKRHAENEGLTAEEMKVYLERGLWYLWNEFARERDHLR